MLDVQLKDLQHFAAGLHDIGIHARSQCRILSGVRSFFRFLFPGVPGHLGQVDSLTRLYDHVVPGFGGIFPSVICKFLAPLLKSDSYDMGHLPLASINNNNNCSIAADRLTFRETLSLARAIPSRMRT